VRAAVKIPFTVKFRAGWSDSEIVCAELARMAESCGLAAVALHARTREQGYSGNARWEWIAAVKNAVKIPVIGNGDIRSPEDACAMVAQTGCDAVMIGRMAPSNPWIFRQIEQYCARIGRDHVGTAAPGCPVERSSTALGVRHSDGISSGLRPDGQPRVAVPTLNPRYDQPSEFDRYQMIRTYFEMLIEEELPDAVGKMKQFASWFTHGVPGGAGLRKAIYESKAAPEVLCRVEEFFEARLCSAGEAVELCSTGQPRAAVPT
jgi:tRNA-dihydrouridine synthase B